jgi:hypothetical protein
LQTCKSWLIENGAPGASFSAFGGAMLPGGDSWSSCYCPVALATGGELALGFSTYAVLLSNR